MANKILLLDSNSLMHRAYHALPNLKTSKGQYTGAIFGFMSILLRLIKEQQPTHIAAAFDLKGPTFRNEMYDAYKANRKPMDEELRQQVEPLKQLIELMGVKIVSKQGFEGDDILGTLSKKFGDKCIIVTGDRDSFQLASPTTKIFWTKKGVSEIEVYDPARLLEDGFTVEQYIDFKALRGDPSDNIPGVAGVGEKTAKTLLEKYGSLDEVLKNASEIKGKLGETLAASGDIARLSRELATIKTDVPLDLTIDDLKFNPIYPQSVKARLAELEMTSLYSRMTFEAADDSVEATSFEKNIEKISDLATLDGVKKTDKIAVFIGEQASFSFDGKKEYVFDCATDLFGGGLSFEEAIDAIKKLAEGRELICYDYKTISKTYGFESRKFFDVMIAAHLARDSAPIKSAQQALNMPDAGAAEMYAESQKLKTILAQKGLERLFYDVEQPLCVVLRNMELRGVRVSSDVLKQLEAKYGEIIDSLTKQIYDAAGCKFNIASPKQLGEVLYEKLQLAKGKPPKTKTGYSVSEDTLNALQSEHPIIKLVLNYRHYAKLQSTYVVGLQPLIVKGRIHTEYNQCITMTGRLSSTNPNLQNLPARSEEARDIKSAFLPSEGYKLVSADYSQIELRLLAHFSEDEQLISAFNNNDDIHALTASQILGVPLSEVTPSQRRDAKAVNFGIIYGISGFGLAENLSIPKYRAQEFINNYFFTHPKVRAYMDSCVIVARDRGYAMTMLGRRRDLSDLKASNYTIRSAAERMAMNTPLQGSAADIIKLAMLGVERRLENYKSKMILQIHDELIIDTAPDEVEDVKRILSEEMQNAVKLKVPLVAEATAADDWASLK